MFVHRRHFKPTPGLPERLQPDCMVRGRGLRANVIRALYHTYDPVCLSSDGYLTFKGLILMSHLEKV